MMIAAQIDQPLMVPSCTSIISTAPTSSLSAIGSSMRPRVDCCSQMRAKYPSSQSVTPANTNSEKADQRATSPSRKNRQATSAGTAATPQPSVPAGGRHDGGHGHDDAGSESSGVVARFTGPDGKDAGFVRLKLHDDKGDLEIWIARDAKFAEPFDLPLDSKVTVTFVDKGGKSVELRVRNRDQNEDEEGKATVRGGRTNYFIFPGDSGQDASWLKGVAFLATVKVGFEADGKSQVTPAFVLRPHSHGDGHDHAH